jgi:hypothetical protein
MDSRSAAPSNARKRKAGGRKAPPLDRRWLQTFEGVCVRRAALERAMHNESGMNRNVLYDLYVEADNIRTAMYAMYEQYEQVSTTQDNQ